MKNLREELTDVTEKQRSKEERIELVTVDLYEKYKHNIKLEDYCHCSRNDNSGCYNCFMYALNVHESQVIIKKAIEYPKAFINSNFIHHLLDSGLLIEVGKELVNSCIILYFKDKKVVHGGKIYNDKIVSKWGPGELWSHNIYEVPTVYGNEVKYYSNVSSKKIEEEFLNFYS